MTKPTTQVTFPRYHRGMEHHRKLERMYLRAPINRLIYEPTIAIAEGEATIAIDVHEKYFHAANAMHGSVYFKMLDDVCFFAVASLVEDVFVLTTSFTTYFTRPIASGRVTSRGRSFTAGRMFSSRRPRLR